MTLTPDQPLDADGQGGTSLLRDARLALTEPACYAERDGSAGPTLDGQPLLNVAGSILTDRGGVTTLASVSCAAPYRGGAVVVADAGTGDTLARIRRDGEVSVGVPSVGQPILENLNYWGGMPSGHGFVHTYNGVEADLERTLYKRFVGYRLVPFTADAEGGRPTVYRVESQAVLDAERNGFGFQGTAQAGATISAPVSETTAYVDVYKTYTLNTFGFPVHLSDGAPTRGGGDGFSDGLVRSPEFFFYERVQVDNGSIIFTDDAFYILASALVPDADDGTKDSLGRREGRLKNGSRVVVPTQPYARPLVATAGVYLAGLGDEFSSRLALVSGGRTFYGAPTFRTVRADPYLVYREIPGDTRTGRIVSLAFEYDADGTAVVGPSWDSIAAVLSLSVAADGPEVALRVSIGGKLYERIVPNDLGIFATTYGKRDAQVSFEAGVYDASRLRSDALLEVASVTEPIAVYESSASRPREVTFSQFAVPLGSEVRMLAPARLAEAEALQDYGFYVSSDEGIWAVDRGGDGFTQSEVATTWAVGLGASIRSDLGAAPALVPLVAPVPQGLVVYGTDGHLHLLSGRSDQRIDGPLRPLVGACLSLAFDPRPSVATLPDGASVGPILWALYDDAPGAAGTEVGYGGTGRSVYGLSLGNADAPGGWIAHRATTATALFFDGDRLLELGDDGASVVLDGSGPRRATSLWASGRVSDAERVAVGAVRADVNGGVFDTSEVVTVRASVRHPAIAPIGRAATAGEAAREATVSADRPFWPRIKGRALQLAVRGFASFRSITDEPPDR